MKLVPEPGFTEDWFCEQSCEQLANIGRHVEDVPGLIVEIGSWEGRSTVALANAIWPRKVVAVDTWQGSPGELSAALAADRDVYARFVQNVACMTKGNVDPKPMNWRDYVPLVDEPIALLFIDAEHTYNEVRDTIAAFRPLMHPNGVMCGDDIHHPPVQRAVVEAFGDAGWAASMWVVRL